MANTAYNHKLTEYQKKIMNSSVATRFCITMGNHGFCNGTKAENFEIEFGKRIKYQYGSTKYQKKQDCFFLGGEGSMFFNCVNIPNVLGEIHDFMLSRLLKRRMLEIPY